MKRFSAAAFVSLLCVACTQQRLPALEVFVRAREAIRDFSSATFVIHARSEGGMSEWSADADGRMASGGRQLAFDLDAAMGGNSQEASFRGSLSIPAEGEVYVKADDLSVGGAMGPLLSAVEGTWWKLPETASGAQTGLSVTPDPSLLALQMETVEITREHGIERINQHSAYKYDVTMDREKVIAYLRTVEENRDGAFDEGEWRDYLDARDIRGTLWIDAEHFLPNRMEWTIVSSDPANPETVSFDVTFANHNEDLQVLPPEQFSPFPVTLGNLNELLLPGDTQSETPEEPSLP